jgi:hypothetical protein
MTNENHGDWLSCVVNLGYNNSCSTVLHVYAATFSNIPETADGDFFTSGKDISTSHETIRKEVLASMNVIELLVKAMYYWLFEFAKDI